jgi:hypothetical protein
MTPEKEAIFEAAIVSCGGKLSLGDPSKGKPNKIFKHKRKFMFCEAPYSVDPSDGKPKRVPVAHLSLWSAPSGGSKGNVDWFNQPSSIIQHYAEAGLSTSTPFWKRTKTWHTNSAAYKLGIPLGADIPLGGTMHPAFPAKAGLNPRDNQAWLSRVSQLTVPELALGTGLSVIPSGLSDTTRAVVKAELTKIEHMTIRKGVRTIISALTDQPQTRVLKTRLNFATRVREVISDDTVDNLPLRDAADTLARITSSAEAYFRSPPKPIRTPSVAKTAQVFRSKVRRRHVLSNEHEFTYEGTMTDLVCKAMSYVHVDAVNDLLPIATMHRAYGLSKSEQEKKTQIRAHWDHLAVSRPDRAYLRMGPVMGLKGG